MIYLFKYFCVICTPFTLRYYVVLSPPSLDLFALYEYVRLSSGQDIDEHEKKGNVYSGACIAVTPLTGRRTGGHRYTAASCYYCASYILLCHAGVGQIIHVIRRSMTKTPEDVSVVRVTRNSNTTP